MASRSVGAMALIGHSCYVETMINVKDTNYELLTSVLKLINPVLLGQSKVMQCFKNALSKDITGQ